MGLIVFLEKGSDKADNDSDKADNDADKADNDREGWTSETGRGLCGVL